MLYLPQSWVTEMMQRRGLGDVSVIEAAFRHTLTDDSQLITAIQQAFFAAPAVTPSETIEAEWLRIQHRRLTKQQIGGDLG